MFPAVVDKGNRPVGLRNPIHGHARLADLGKLLQDIDFVDRPDEVVAAFNTTSPARISLSKILPGNTAPDYLDGRSNAARAFTSLPNPAFLANSITR
jgi:hypothetical protein